MNNYILFFIAISILLSCKQKPHTSSVKIADETISLISDNPNTIITGNIYNSQSEFVVLSQGLLSDTVYFDTDKNFRLEISISSPNYYRLSDGKKSINIFLEPNKDLNISFNCKDIFNSIQFTGDGAEPNIYIKDKYLLMIDHTIPLVHLYEQPVKEFRHVVDSFYVIDKMFLDEFISNNPNVPTTFKSTELASIKYDRATKLIDYLNTNSTGYKATNTKYLCFLNKLSVNDSSLLEVFEYKMFLNSLITHYSNEKIENLNLASYEIALIKMESVIENIQNQEVIDYLMYTILKEQVKYYGYKNTTNLFEVFDNKCKNVQFRNKLLTPYNEFLNLSKKPKAPRIAMTNITGAEYGLQNFNGKYIYIDVWATWCLPCRKQTPYFEALKEEYKHKNIEFISISIDKKRTDWIEFIEMKTLTENQFIIDDIEPFLNDYMIKTIPHFLIIDDKGYLINANANRPSNIDKKWFDNLPNKEVV